MDNDDVISTLNDLIETSKDGEQGFLTSAEHVSSSELQTLFQQASARCAQGARELQQEVRRLGGDPDTTGSVSGALHRGWVNIKSAVTGKDDKAILTEVERGESVAEERYREALKKDLPSDIRAIVERQHRGVVENYDRVRTLRAPYKDPTGDD